MKLARFAAAAALTALSVAACSAHSETRNAGPVVERNYQVGAFQRIAVAGPYEVIVRAGGQPGIHARGGSAVLDDTIVTVENGTLKIRGKDKRGINWSWGHDGKVTIEVNGAGALDGAAVTGSGGVRIDSVKTARFSGELAGSGDLSIDRIEAGDVSLAIAGSGDIHAAGKTNTLAVNIAGSGDADLSGLGAVSADLSIAGSGNVRARATGTANLSIMGSGDIELTGGARCNVSKHGSGDVHCS